MIYRDLLNLSCLRKARVAEGRMGVRAFCWGKADGEGAKAALGYGLTIAL
jgi:hypothetical protein